MLPALSRILATSTLLLLAVPPADARERLVLECDSVFTPNVSAAQLAEHFGAENVKTGRIFTGEGYSDRGTLIFSRTVNEAQVEWYDEEKLERVRIVRIRKDSSNWVARNGLKMHLDLKSIERLNGGPFGLEGFNFDYASTVVTWLDGALELPEGNTCGVRVALGVVDQPRTPERLEMMHRLSGERRFSSRNQDMQDLNPTVYQLLLFFR